MGNRFSTTFILLFSFLSLHGQSLRSHLRKAKESYFRKEYSMAFHYAEKALEKDSLLVEALFFGGESARQLRNFEMAERYLSRITDEEQEGAFAATDFYLGLCQKNLGKYQKAKSSFDRYLKEQAGDNDSLAERAREEIWECKWALQRSGEKPTADIAEDPTVEHTSKVRFAPLRYADKIYFTATLENTNGEEPVTRIFAQTPGNPARLGPNSPSRKDVHAAHVALMPDASKMYYTICRDEKYYQQKECEIWSAIRTYEGTWKAPSKLPEPVNLPSFTATQPTIGWDKHLKKYVLYFVSDRPGGKGGMDVWYSAIGWNGEFGTPVNLHTNTAGNDITPYFHQASQTLFFSSDQRPGLGGYDIFQMAKDDQGTWSEPENMGAPLNTSFDDIYFTWNTGAQRAYFSSNRSNRECPDAADGDFCLDIFEAEIFATVAVQAEDAINELAIEDFDVHIKAEKDALPPFEIDNKKNARSKIVLPVGRKYTVTVSAEGYEPHKFTLNTAKITKSTFLNETVALKPEKVIKP